MRVRQPVVLAVVVLCALVALVGARASHAATPQGTKGALLIAITGDAPNPGTVSGGGFACTLKISDATLDDDDFPTASPCLRFFSSLGASFTLTARPSAGHRFVRWERSCSGEDPRLRVVIDQRFAFAGAGAVPDCIAVFEQGAPPPADDCPTASSDRALTASGGSCEDLCLSPSAIKDTNGDHVVDATDGVSDANDVVCGSEQADRLLGLGGNDILVGLGGEDTLLGGPGNDTLFGVGDVSFGGDGDDTLKLSGGVPFATGGRGNDSIVVAGATGFGVFGCGGNDDLTGDGGDQVLSGDYLAVPSGQAALALGLSADEEDVQCDPAIDAPLGVTAGEDILTGRGGKDELHGGPGNDLLFGNAGADRLFGEGGDDTEDAGPDRDLVVGGPGDDTLGGGEDDDTVIGCGGRDVLFGEGGKDRLEGDGAAPDNGCRPIEGDPSPGDTTESADRLVGGKGADFLKGGNGNDALVGGPGIDVMRGGPGSDGLNAKDGLRDVVDGGGACDDGVLDRIDRRISIEFANLDGPTAICTVVEPGPSAPDP